MDFFEHQEKARRNSHVLIFYFCLAVLGIIFAVYALLTGLSFFIESKRGGAAALDFWKPGLFTATSLGTGLVVFLASSFKTMQLSGGGKVVARELGGRVLDTHTTDFHERRLLNVVEEMAIASGVPVPEVYVMDSEDSINAFAAGKTTSDAVIGITRGCMKLLTRDELQGVVAHEFSHILNGDMRLNMRLIGLLFGILFLTLMGEVLMRTTQYTRYSRNRDSGGAVLLIFVLGIGLMAIGSIGMFFANLIKASISRQREFLADASAVQFTRNPDGIGGALRKIGALSKGSSIGHPMARDASHMFFGSAFSSNAFATHPPLEIRIKRILPHWDGKFEKVRLPPITEQSDVSSGPKDKEKGIGGLPGFPIPGMMLAGDEAEMYLSENEAKESMRTVHPEQIVLGQGIHREMPRHWIDAAHSEPGAQAIVFALLLSRDKKLRKHELNQLYEATDPYTFDYVSGLYEELGKLHSAVKLALIDLSIPTLRKLSPSEYRRFRRVMQGLVTSDKVVDLFEFALQKIVGRHLDNYFSSARPGRIQYSSIDQLTKEAAVVMSTLAALSNPESESDIAAAFANGSEHFEDLTGRPLVFEPAENCGLQEIRTAIERFEKSSPLVKKEFLIACSKTALADGKLSSQEAELIRAIADAMGCAIPPFVRTAPLTYLSK